MVRLSLAQRRTFHTCLILSPECLQILSCSAVFKQLPILRTGNQSKRASTVSRLLLEGLPRPLSICHGCQCAA